MAKKLIVTTDVGMFARSTARTYTHIVVVKDVRHECLEAHRLVELAECRKQATRYREILATGVDKQDRHDWDRKNTTRWIADGSLLKWATEYEASITKLEALGPITEDKATVWSDHSWCGRLDLARKVYASADMQRFRFVRIYDIATGQEVRW
jgi:hypothetical protein